MSFNLTSLTEFVNQKSDDLIARSIVGARTSQFINVYEGVKNVDALPILDTDLKLRAGSCGFNPDGSTNITQVEIRVGDFLSQESLCSLDLEKYFTNMALPAGSNNLDMPFEEVYLNMKADLVAAEVDNLLWNGDTSSATASMAIADGFIKILEDDGSYINGNVLGATAITDANIIDIFDDLVESVPSIIKKKDLVAFCGYDVYTKYRRQLKNAFGIRGGELVVGEDLEDVMFIPDTKIKLIAIDPLTGTDKIVLGASDNFIHGTDLKGDYEDFYMEVDRKTRTVDFQVAGKVGSQVIFKQEVVYYKNV